MEQDRVECVWSLEHHLLQWAALKEGDGGSHLEDVARLGEGNPGGSTLWEDQIKLRNHLGGQVHSARLKRTGVYKMTHSVGDMRKRVLGGK